MSKNHARIIVPTALCLLAAGGFLYNKEMPRPQSAVSPAAPVVPVADQRAKVKHSFAALPLSFERNIGQFDKDIAFGARGSGFSAGISANRATLHLRRQGSDKKAPSVPVSMVLEGARANAPAKAEQPLPGKVNYLIGKDPKKWHTDIPTSARVHFDDVYPGIDLTYLGNGCRLQYDFTVAPGGDTKQIRLAYEGIQSVQITNDGELSLETEAGGLKWQKPIAYQENGKERQPVAARYALLDNDRIGFQVGAYDHSRPLVIDPTLTVSYSTFLGGSGSDVGNGIAVDRSGNAYVTGWTDSTTLAGSTGATTLGSRSGTDGYVAKLNSTGTTLSYLTFIGGSGTDQPNGIAASLTGLAFIVGNTSSGDFPTSSGFQSNLLGSSNAFIVALNSTGNTESYGTYYGASGTATVTSGSAIAYDSATGNVFITGETDGSTLTITGGAQTSYGGGSTDGFLARVRPSAGAGSSLLYSTYIGGSGTDSGGGIAVSGTDAYVSGTTTSSDLGTVGGSQASSGGGQDAFAGKYDTAVTGTTSLSYLSYLGGSNTESGTAIAVNSSGNAYITGFTSSTNFPTSSGALQTSLSSGTDAFVTEVSSTGSSVIYSTYLGGSGTDAGRGIQVDGSGYAYIAGGTDSTDFPLQSAAQSSIGGNSDGFISKLDTTGSFLVYSSYLGGTAFEQCNGIALDSSGDAFVAGNTESSDFPTSTGSLQTSYGGSQDAFVTKFGALAPTTSTVNVTDDHDDGTCDTTDCSLREAINAANSGAAGSSIEFSIPAADPGVDASGVATISLTIALPDITNNGVTVDATTQAGFTGSPLIQLTGTGPNSFNGLTITGADNCTIRGFILNGFSEAIRIGGDSGHLQASGHLIAGNYIGTDETGTAVAALQNGYGIMFQGDGFTTGTGVSNSTIGGTASADRNIIAGSTNDGILLGEQTAGTSSGNVIEGNYIGTDATGTVSLGNARFGIWMGTSNNTIGGSLSGTGNVISANANQIMLSSGSNTVSGNYVGVDSSGGSALSNAGSGIVIDGSSNNTIGGTTAAERNVISGNSSYGIEIKFSGSFGAGPTTGNAVQGNYIGTDSAGTASVGNGSGGIVIDFASNNTIGGTAGGEGNTISGNTNAGVSLNNANGTIIEGNGIGVNAAGTGSLGNGQMGIELLDGATNSTIGGTAAGAGNTIGGNGSFGIHAFSTSGSISGNVIEGNYIGTDSGGTLNLGNGDDGIRLTTAGGATTGPADNTIGGTAAGAGNIIAFNTGYGVLIGTNDPANVLVIGNAVRENRISSNTSGGINLFPGAATNDAGDSDAGPNDYQNFPVLSDAVTDGANTTITGTLDTDGNTLSYDIDFFASTTADASGHGQGETFLGTVSVTTDAAGHASISATLPVGVTAGQFITATATRGTAPFDTSEFAANIVAHLPQITTVNTTADHDDGSCDTTDCTLREAINGANATPGSTIDFNISGGGVQTISPTSALPAITADGTIIDGYTQTGATANTLAIGDNAALKIVLDGTGLGSIDGLELDSANNTIKGLNIHSFGNFNLHINGAGATGNTVQGCFIGTNVSGTAAASGNGEGIFIDAGGNNTIGGTVPAARNIVSGNTGVQGMGVHVDSSDNNFIQGNYIGTNASGTAAIRNISGINIGNCSFNTIGGTTAGAGNLISGNSGNSSFPSGVFLNTTVPGIANQNVVQGNLIGTDATGTTAVPNGFAGIRMDSSSGSSLSSNNTIGGVIAGAANTIAFNNGYGVYVTGTSDSIRGNSIHDNTGLGINLVGGTEDSNGVTANDTGDADTGPNNLQNFPVITGVTGTTVSGTLNSLANTQFAIDVYDNSSSDSSGFGEGATYLGSKSVTTDANGDATFSLTTGLVSSGYVTATATTTATGNTSEFSQAFLAGPIIVTNTGDSNTVGSGSLRAAINYANANPGTTIAFAIPTSDPNFAGGVYTIKPGSALPAITADGTIIDGSTQPGFIAGNAPVIRLDGTNAGQSVGLTTSAANGAFKMLNIANFGANGIRITGTGASGNTIQGCYIGTDATGSTANANGGNSGSPYLGAENGILIDHGATNNVIGTGSSGNATLRNVISGNAASGIYINDFDGDGTASNTISGNYIGINAAGNARVRNEGAGIALDYRTHDNKVGLTGANNGNVLSGQDEGSGTSGLAISQGVFNTTVVNNFIGTDSTGATSISNQHGITFGFGAHNNTIGGTTAAERNVISGNYDTGIYVSGVTANVIEGNYVGCNSSGSTPVANGNGINITDNSTGNIIGGIGANQGNVIVFNTASGVVVSASGSTGNTIRGNSIHDNTGLGINLDGGTEDANEVTANDNDDPDTGPNNLQNYPVITSIISDTSSNISGTLNSLPNTTFGIDVYSNTSPDPSGSGEGATLLGSTLITTDANGDATFGLTSVNVNGLYVTATATATVAGDTSEFSAAFLAGPIIVTNTGDSNAVGSGSLRAAINYANANPGTTIQFNIPGGGQQTITPAIALPDITAANTVISGYSQPGSLSNTASTSDNAVINVVISGASIGTTPTLKIAADNCVVTGLALTNGFYGVNITNGATGVSVVGCFLGTADGTTSALSFIDVVLDDGAVQNTIGGSSPAERNIIGSLWINGTNNTHQNLVQGNFIGLDASGTASLTGSGGVLLSLGTTGNLIGGSNSGEGNVISGAQFVGITLQDTGTSNNAIEGNIIGLDATGTQTLTASNRVGILVENGASSNDIGGTNNVDPANNVISGNQFDGIEIDGAGTTGNRVMGNSIGPDINGAGGVGNGQHGVAVSGGAQNNAIGLTFAGSTISGNGADGISLFGIGTTDNTVLNNRIGTNAGGTAALANGGNGISLSSGASSTIIGGGSSISERNIISGNTGYGVELTDSTTTTNTISGNYIGVATSGSAALGNTLGGIHLAGGATNNLIGDSVASGGNVISGNGQMGVFVVGNGTDNNSIDSNIIGASANGLADLGNGSHGILVQSGPKDNIIASNQISGNAGSGVYLLGDIASASTTTSDNQVMTNVIGLASNGTSGLPNDGNGVSITLGSNSNTIGGSIATDGNVISGNKLAGIEILGDGVNNLPDLNTIANNFIGTDVGGTQDVGNLKEGIKISGGTGDNSVGPGNVISGNNTDGILLSGAGTSTNRICGNFIGVDKTGATALGNTLTGISLLSGPSNTIIGGIDPEDPNTISGNGSHGIVLSGAATSTNSILQNFIGTDNTGVSAISNGGNGIDVLNAPLPVIGGSSAAERNIISGNAGHGIRFSGATDGIVKGNYIGLKSDGTSALGNQGHGILYQLGANSHTVDSNRIAFNSLNGIAIDDNTDGVVIERNSIFSNTQLGIDLKIDGVTSNDTNDPDTGANDLQNYPVLTNADVTGGTTTIDGTLNSLSNRLYHLEFFANTTGDGSGHGEGAQFIGSKDVTTDGSGNVAFTFTTSTAVIGTVFSATASDMVTFNTSEFSANVTAVAVASNIVTNTNDSGAGSLRAAINFANANPGTQIKFNIPKSDPGFAGGVFTIKPLTVLPDVTADATSIIGGTQTNFTGNSNPLGPEIVIDGSLIPRGAFIPGLTITASNCLVRAVVMNNFESSALSIQAVPGTPGTGSNNHVEGCYLGTDPVGEKSAPNGNGVSVSNGATNNVIGGSSAIIGQVKGNLISGNIGYGVVIEDAGTTGNKVSGNLIGLHRDAHHLLLDGTGAPATGTGGIVIDNGATNNTIGGNTPALRNIISGNQGNVGGVFIVGTGTANNLVQGNYIGTDLTGNLALPNSFAGGVLIADNAHDNIIGGQTSTPGNGVGNVISGNEGHGVSISVSTPGSIPPFNNKMFGNVIGLTALGNRPLPNTVSGIGITKGAHDNSIGSSNSADRNLLSGNTQYGVAIVDAGSNNNSVQGNYIGTDYSGTVAIGNGINGVAVFAGAKNNAIGGASAGAGNLVCGNVVDGISLSDAGTTGNLIAGNSIGVNITGNFALPNKRTGISIFGGAGTNTVGGTSVAARNVISGNDLDGIAITGSNGNLIQGNFIGTTSNGLSGVPNGNNGLSIFGGAKNNTVGGTTAATHNLISGNKKEGVAISGTGTNANKVLNNHIGLNAAGTAAVVNRLNGIIIFGGAQQNIVGDAGVGNVISGNLIGGVRLSGAGTNSNKVAANFIGTNPAGTAAIPNGMGISIDQTAKSNQIGGSAGLRNIIAGNLSHGLLLSDTGTSGNTVEGNFIGCDSGGTKAIGNGNGVTILGAQSNSIGGTSAALRNVISGNKGAGVFLDSFNGIATGNTFQGNYIGATPAGTAGIANGVGVVIREGARSNIFGGTVAGAGNLIAYNTGNGASIESLNSDKNSFINNTVTRNGLNGIKVQGASSGSPQGNTFRGNLISANGQLGIDLAPTGAASGLVTANDTKDVDTGPNGLQNFPVISSAVLNGNTLSLGVTLNSVPNTKFALEFFRNTAADPSGNGEGEILLGAAIITTDANGNFQGSQNLAAGGAVLGQFVAATATNITTGDTSEFGKDVKIIAPVNNNAVTLTITPTTFSEKAGPKAALGTVTRAAADPTPLVVNLKSSNPGAAAVPATVTIAANQKSINFDIAAIDDGVLNNPRTAIVTASTAGFPAGSSVTVTITEADVPTLTLSIAPATFSESAGAGAATGTVTRNGSTAGSLVVTLTSSNTSQVQVPASVTIPAGKSSITFKLDAVRDFIPNNPQTVTITAKATGFPTATANVHVLEGDTASSIVVTLEPASIIMVPGESFQFQAQVQNSSNTAVTFAVQEANGGSITSGGLYTAPGIEGTFHIVATSVADPTKKDIALVVVTNSVTRKLFGWGLNQYGQTGISSGSVVPAPAPVSLSQVRGLAAHGSHTLAVIADGSVWAWGYNGAGQLGDGGTTSHSNPTPVRQRDGSFLNLGSGATSRNIAGGWYHSLAVKADGSVWAWGLNQFGQLGDGTIVNKSGAVRVNGLSSITTVAGGVYHSLALDSSGRVWAWGSNFYGQLGNGTHDNTPHSTPQLVAGLLASGERAIAIAAGAGHSLAVVRQANGVNVVRAWGWNLYGQLGNGNTTDRSTPGNVLSGGGNLQGITGVSAGYVHTLALTSGGTLMAWGNDSYGQLGNGGSADIAVTRAVPVQSITNVQSIAAGAGFSVALRNNGTLWVWGSNAYSALGLSADTSNKSVPTQVPSLREVTMASAGYAHAVAVGNTIPASTAPFVSVLRYSTATSSSVDNAVQLTFTGQLDADTATDMRHWSVLVNGIATDVESVAISGGNRVTLKLGDGAFGTGDKLAIAWDGLKDNNGAALPNQKINLTGK